MKSDEWSNGKAVWTQSRALAGGVFAASHCTTARLLMPTPPHSPLAAGRVIALDMVAALAGTATQPLPGIIS